MEYLTQNNSDLPLTACLETSDASTIVTSDTSVPINDMLVSPAIASPSVSEVPSKKSERSEKGDQRRKRKHTSAIAETSRKSARAKKVKETEIFSPVDPGVGPHGQMSYTPASSSSPGDSLSDRKVQGSSVDNVYEFTEQEEGHKPPDETLLKRKRNSRNYGKPKNRWLLETELKNINDSRRRTLNDNDDVPTPDSQVGGSEANHSSSEQRAVNGGQGHNAQGFSSFKLRICRSAANGSYECHLIDKEPTVASASPQYFRTTRGDCFRIGDVVWAKLVGWPWWPAQLQSFCVDSAGLAQVKWFNWDQISYVHCEKLHHFIAAFNSKVDKRKKAGAYKLAIEQAWKLASAIKDRQNDELYDSAADDESSSSEEDGFCAQSLVTKQQCLKSPIMNGSSLSASVSKASQNTIAPPISSQPPQNFSLTTVASSHRTEPSPVFQPPMSSQLVVCSAEERQAPDDSEAMLSRPSFSTPTSQNITTEGFGSVAPHFDLFDSSSVGDTFGAFDDDAAVRSSGIVGLGPLPDIGPNLNLINPSNMYSFIPSFSDDDDMDTRPVLDPASIDSIMT